MHHAGARILRMAAYSYSEKVINALARKMMRTRLWVGSIATVLLVLDLPFVFDRAGSIASRIRVPEPLADGAFIVCFVLLVQSIRSLSRAPRSIEEHLRSYRVHVSPQGVSVTNDAVPMRQIALPEIRRAEIPSLGSGLYLRGTNRYRWLLVPSGLDEYAEIKTELEASSIPFKKTLIPPNWEEFVLILVFFCSLGCDEFLKNRNLLILNLLVGAVVGIGFFVIVNKGWAHMHNRKLARFGCLFPPVCAGIALLANLLHWG